MTFINIFIRQNQFCETLIRIIIFLIADDSIVLDNLEHPIMEVETDNSVSVPVHIVGHKDNLIFFRFKPHQSDQYETGICKELFNDRKKSQKIKMKDYLSFGNDSSPCYTNMVVPLSCDEKYLAENGDSMFPKWQAKYIWHEVKSEAKCALRSKNEQSALELQTHFGNPFNLEIEKLSNVPGKLYRRKRWKARNGMGFVRFMYEGQIAYARVRLTFLLLTQQMYAF